MGAALPGQTLSAGEIYGLSKEKRKMLMLAAEHAESAPPLVFGEKSRGGPAAGGGGRQREAAGSCDLSRRLGHYITVRPAKTFPAQVKTKWTALSGDLLQRAAALIARGDVGGGRRRGEADAGRWSPLVRVIWIPSLTNRKKNKNTSKELSGQFLSGKLNFRTLPPGALPAN